MSMDLGFRLYFAVNESECRDGKIKILAVPVRLSQGELLTECSLVDLDDVYSVSFEIQYFISYCKRDLKYALLDGDIFSRERPVKDRNRSGEHAFYGFIRAGLCELGPLYRNGLSS